MADRLECGLAVVVDACEGAALRLGAALGAARVLSVVIRGHGGKALDVAAARPLVELAQKGGAAALIENDARLARTLKADGAHLAVEKGLMAAYEEARELLGERFVVGAYAGKSRHDAMVLAERGADYVAFGAPDGIKDREAALARRLDLVAWWAEIFEVPCLVLDVATPQEAHELSRAGADFVATVLEAGLPVAEAGSRVAGIARALQGEL